MHEYVRVFLTGAAMGVAEVIPGVSGGTIALVGGVYDRLVGAIASLHPRSLRHLPYLHRRDHREGLLDELRAMDIPFLITLGLGMGAMVVLLAQGITVILEDYPGATYAFFGGLILVSAVILYRHVEIDTPKRVVLALTAAALAFVLSGFATDGLGHSLPVVFVAGGIAVTATVLPGVSGSLLLLALGQYEYMIDTLNSFVDSIGDLLTGTGASSQVTDAGIPVVTFLGGAAIGVVSMAHAVNYALERAKDPTLIVLVSLMVGALRVPGEEVIDAYQPEPGWIALTAFGAIAGALAIWVFDYYTGELAY